MTLQFTAGFFHSTVRNTLYLKANTAKDITISNYFYNHKSKDTVVLLPGFMQNLYLFVVVFFKLNPVSLVC